MPTPTLTALLVFAVTALAVTAVLWRQSLAKINTTLAKLAEAQSARDTAIAQQADCEKRFQHMVENSSDIVTILDGAGVVTYLGPSVSRIMGYSDDELLGKSVFTFLHPDEVDTAAKLFSRYHDVSGPVPPITLRLKRQQLGWRWFEITGINHLDNPKYRGFLFNGHDVTESREADLQRREDEARYRLIIDNSFDVMLIADSAGMIRFVSPSVEQMLGCKPEACLGTRGLRLMHPADRRLWLNRLGPRPVDGGVTRVRARHSDGNFRWIEIVSRDMSNDPIVKGLLLTIRDITAQVEADEERIRQTKMLDALNRATLALVEQRTSPNVLAAIVRQAATMLDTEDAYVDLVNEKLNALENVYSSGFFSRHALASMKIGEGLSGRVWQTGKSMTVADYDRWAGKSTQVTYGTAKAALCVPINFGSDSNERVVGIIGMARDNNDCGFRPDEINFIERFAQLAAVALSNAQLYEALNVQLEERARDVGALRQQKHYIEMLNEASLAVASKLNPQDLLQFICDRATELLNSEGSFIDLVSESTANLLEDRAASGAFATGPAVTLTYGVGLGGSVWESEQTIVLDDYSLWPRAIPELIGTIKAALCAPIKLGGLVVGVFGIRRQEPYQPEEVDIFTRFTNLAAIAIDNARLINSLRERESQYRNIVEAVTDGIAIVDPTTSTLVDVNPAMAAMHGYPREELLGLEVLKLIAPGHAILGAYNADGQRTDNDFEGQSTNRRKDGTSFDVQVVGRMMPFAGKPHLLAVVHDITEQVHATQLLEERVAIRTQLLAELLEISQSILSSQDKNTVLQKILEKLVEMAPASAAHVDLLDDEGTMRIAYYAGPQAKERVLRQFTPRATIPYYSKLLTDRQPLLIPDTLDDSPVSQAFRDCRANMFGEFDPAVRCILAVPISIGEKVYGALMLESSQAGAYAPADAPLALSFASQAAMAMESDRLRQAAMESATLTERSRIARELHDSVSQALFGIVLGMRTAEQAIRSPKPVAAAGSIDYSLALAEGALAEMRALIFELRPESLSKDGLIMALEKQAESMLARYKITVRSELCSEPSISITAKEGLYRIVTEALQNVVKHAKATLVLLSLRAIDTSLTLTVQDDGRGFNTSSEFPGHIGLSTMRERAERLGAVFSATSQPGKGTTIQVVLPLE